MLLRNRGSLTVCDKYFVIFVFLFVNFFKKPVLKLQKYGKINASRVALIFNGMEDSK